MKTLSVSLAYALTVALGLSLLTSLLKFTTYSGCGKRWTIERYVYGNLFCEAK